MQASTQRIPGLNGRIRPEWRLNSQEVVEDLRKNKQVLLESVVDVKERERQSSTIHGDAKRHGLNVSILSGWVLGDNWIQKKKGDTQPEGSQLYLRVILREW